MSEAEWVDITELVPWDKNPRVNDGAVDAIAKSIERFGFASPIIARRADSVVIAGHTRLKASQKLGLDKVLVRFMDLDPAMARALALADNRLGEIADWSEGLGEVLRELEADGLDLDGLGWDADELDGLLDSPEPDLGSGEPGDGGAGDDLIPENVEPLTKPGEVVQLGRHTLHCSDCLEVMRGLPDNSVDSICTDPPYGIGFMSKGWDCEVPGDAFASEALRVLKPGGHIVAFAATRTVHRLAVNLEDAGFELRDMVGWVQWQGFPKSLDASKALDQHHGAEREVIGYGPPRTITSHCMSNGGQNRIGSRKTFFGGPVSEDAKRWSGWGTALKPAFEPAVLARKPLEGTVAENLIKWGVGAINVDGCRIADGDSAWPGPGERHEDLGRWPANIYHCPKPSRGEREAGDWEGVPSTTREAVTGRAPDSAGQAHARSGMTRTGDIQNHHPTVKPSKLMRWLARLITPPGGLLLEPFCGSGTTLLAAEREGFRCLAVEREPAYCDIIRARYRGGSQDGSSD